MHLLFRFRNRVRSRFPGFQTDFLRRPFSLSFGLRGFSAASFAFRYIRLGNLGSWFWISDPFMRPRRATTPELRVLTISCPGHICNGITPSPTNNRRHFLAKMWHIWRKCRVWSRRHLYLPKLRRQMWCKSLARARWNASTKDVQLQELAKELEAISWFCGTYSSVNSRTHIRMNRGFAYFYAKYIVCFLPFPECTRPECTRNTASAITNDSANSVEERTLIFSMWKW